VNAGYEPNKGGEIVQSAVIPVSFMEEEKEFLGMMSIRQVLILGPSAVLIYLWITAFPLPFLSIGTKVVIKVMGALVVSGFAAALSFLYLDRYEMHFDKYLRIRWKFLRSDKVFYYHNAQS
jgi:hypothetical protein